MMCAYSWTASAFIKSYCANLDPSQPVCSSNVTSASSLRNKEKLLKLFHVFVLALSFFLHILILPLNTEEPPLRYLFPWKPLGLLCLTVVSYSVATLKLRKTDRCSFI